jgi:hypothetical protein
MKFRTILLGGLAALSAVSAHPALATNRLQSELQWSFRHNNAAQGNGAEINAFDPVRQEIYVTGANGVDVLDKAGNYLRTLRLTDSNGEVASVAIKDGIVAIAGPNGTEGRVRFFSTSGTFIRDVAVDTGPDSIAFTPDGARLLVAIEGEPANPNPLGGIAVVQVATGSVNTLGFEDFEAQKVALQAKGALFRPDTTVANDMEPEFVAISADGKKAFVTLQENNLIAVVDLSGGNATIKELIPAGLKDVSTAANAFIHRSTEPTVKTSEGLTGITALRQPDGIATFVHKGVTYIVTADEGEDLGNNLLLPYDASLPQSSIDAITSLQQRRRFWGLDLDKDGDADTISYSGGRSVSIRTEDGTVVWDAGNVFEKAVTELGLLGLNSDRRNGLSIEPENLVVGTVGGRRWLFVGVERGRSIATFDISNPLAPVFNGLIYDTSVGGAFNNFEGLTFISSKASWDGNAYLLASAEDEGWTHLFRLNAIPEPASWAMMIAGFGLVGLVARRRRAAIA